jgi:hypothetical protein
VETEIDLQLGGNVGHGGDLLPVGEQGGGELSCICDEIFGNCWLRDCCVLLLFELRLMFCVGRSFSTSELIASSWLVCVTLSTCLVLSSLSLAALCLIKYEGVRWYNMLH